MAFVLIGFMGAGKSTVARELAEALGGEAHDSDTLLQTRSGLPAGEAFESLGEERFRALEEEIVCDLLSGAGPEQVIALGGGSVLSERVREALAGHTVVLLEIAPERAWERVQRTAGETLRPLARDRARFIALHGERRGLYERLAGAIVPELAPGQAAGLLPALRALAAAPAGTRLLWARSASGDYPVLVAEGLLSSGAETLAAVWPLDRSHSRAFCISDETVAPLYADRLGASGQTITIAAGEASKTLAGAERIWQALLGAGMTRADHLVALGGGVVGDLAGFCAGTYQRGVPFLQVPTTLLAQVDSAYGGKTGVDLPNAKNYVGVYHQPAGVLVDPATLATLPAGELASGWVEVLKTAIIAGGELWQLISTGAEADAEVILRCARTKLEVVAEDERDAGRRQVLNLGHTIGHAIETASGYSRYRHGEAVGLGLLAALRLSGTTELHDQVRELLAARGLPVRLQGLTAEQVVAASGRDKKRLAGNVPFVLVRSPGDVEVGCEVGEQELLAAVAELAA